MTFLTERLYQRRTVKTGMRPGAPVYVGRQKVDEVRVSVTEYDDEGVIEVREVLELDTLTAARQSAPVSWVNVTGLHQTDKVERVGQAFGIHPLLLEDALNTEQRPKVEQYDDYVFVILKYIHWQAEAHQLSTEQITLVLGERFVLTLQEQEQDVFAPILARMRQGVSRIRQQGPDYLAYALLDVVVDHYFVILEQLGEQLEQLEDEVLDRPSPATLTQIQALKRSLLSIRRLIWPLREVVASLARGESTLFQKATLIYLRDVYEHAVQIIDTIDTYREIAASLLDIYLSSVSNRMNEVMKVLTIIATIFIPLTFITSVYGMNFAYMPELGWRMAYPALWFVLLGLSLTMLFLFRRRGWL